MEKKYCPYCKSEQIVEPLGFLAIQLEDGSRIVEYQCKKCCRIIRERKGGKNEKDY
jgi:transposase-like protein